MFIGSSAETALSEYAQFTAAWERATWERWAKRQQPEAYGLEDDHQVSWWEEDEDDA